MPSTKRFQLVVETNPTYGDEQAGILDTLTGDIAFWEDDSAYSKRMACQWLRKLNNHEADVDSCYWTRMERF